ncbi:zinc ribbon domain-containing protein [Dictyobacter kobayashii]|uniref:DZANK-type domain-containing protein n=1 Tax=Dictyobacter kobayashii TaxID=2014872 RepID=A0A402AUK1_9CHLR|nr:zinc ribbon domain-containing protein [Dictyobacter kobayashii]GCE22745.1 hypothetical protein KDK_65450 [Dictyobacter kobayashii]
MSTRFYQSPNLNVDRMIRDFELIFVSQGYQVQHFGNPGHMVVQLRKGGDFEAILGMQAALTVILRNVPGGVVALVGEHHWEEKAATGLLGMIFFWPLILTTGAGVLRQASMEGFLFETLDTVVLQQRPDVKMGPVPPHVEAQMQQQSASTGTPPWSTTSSYEQPASESQAKPHAEWTASSIPAQKPCASCHKLNDTDDIYCSWCGTLLKPQKSYCPRCNAELKQGAGFCAKCGTSINK